MLDGTEPTSAVIELLVKHNILMICPWRSGFAGSTAHECAVEYAPQEFAKDIKFLTEYMELPPCPLVGNMAGSLYAYAAATYYPTLFTSIINLSGTIPIMSDTQISMMSTRQRVIAFTAKYTPRLVRFILRAAVAQVDAGGVDKLVSAMYEGSPFDAELAGDSEIRRLLFEGYRASMAQGQTGFLADGLQVLTDWSQYIDDIKIPIHLIHGTHDPTIKISTVHELCKHYPHIKLTELSDFGQLIFYGDPKTIVEVVRQYL